VDEYCKIIMDIIHVNSSSPGAGGPAAAGISKFIEKTIKSRHKNQR
jgi:hypothetical protein